MIKEEKFEKALEWLENASYNCDNIKKVGIALVPTVKSQIDNAINYLKDEIKEEENDTKRNNQNVS